MLAICETMEASRFWSKQETNAIMKGTIEGGVSAAISPPAKVSRMSGAGGAPSVWAWVTVAVKLANIRQRPSSEALILGAMRQSNKKGGASKARPFQINVASLPCQVTTLSMCSAL